MMSWGGRRRTEEVCDASCLLLCFSLLLFSRLPAFSPSEESLEGPASSPPSPAARSTERTGRRCCCELFRRGGRAERRASVGGDNVVADKGRVPRFNWQIGAAREDDATTDAAATATRGASARAGIVVENTRRGKLGSTFVCQCPSVTKIVRSLAVFLSLFVSLFCSCSLSLSLSSSGVSLLTASERREKRQTHLRSEGGPEPPLSPPPPQKKKRNREDGGRRQRHRGNRWRRRTHAQAAPPRRFPFFLPVAEAATLSAGHGARPGRPGPGGGGQKSRRGRTGGRGRGRRGRAQRHYDRSLDVEENLLDLDGSSRSPRRSLRRRFCPREAPARSLAGAQRSRREVRP